MFLAVLFFEALILTYRHLTPYGKFVNRASCAFPSYLVHVFQSEFLVHRLSYENGFYLEVNENSFSYETLRTNTRFEKETQDNSEMAY